MKCSSDKDCGISLRNGAHSLFCVDGKCSRLKSPGMPCEKATECASYPFFGPLACTDKCAAGFCCLFIPNGSECVANRPGPITGCTRGFECLSTGKGPVCAPAAEKRWILGPILSITGNILINIGLNLQKKSYTNNTVVLFGWSISLFLLGVLVYATGKVSGFSSYIFGNQSMLASLGAVGLVANSVFAPMINKEVFCIYDLAAIVFVLIGSTMIVSNSVGGTHALKLGDLFRMYMAPSTLCWFFLLLGVISILYFTSVTVEEHSDWKMDANPPRISLDVHFTKNGSMLKYYMLFVYVGLSACIASFTTLFAKSFGIMLGQLIAGRISVFYPGLLFYFLLVLLCTIGQIYWLNKALKRYDALLVVPVFHVLWTVTSVTTAGIYFKDFKHFTAAQFRGFLKGLLTIFFGSSFLLFRMRGKETPFTETVSLPIETKQT